MISSTLIIISVLALISIILLIMLMQSRKTAQEYKQEALQHVEKSQHESTLVQKHAQQTLGESDFLKTLIACERIMTHATSSSTMLDEICHTLCDESIFKVVWAGFVKDDTHEVPISWFCDHAEPRFLHSGFHTRLDPSDPYANGPTSEAILTGQDVLIENALKDVRFAEWNSRAKFSGIASVISLPFLPGEGLRPFGALTLYSTNTLTAEESMITHLHDLVNSMARRILHLNKEQRNRKELNFTTNRSQTFQQVLDAVPASIYWKDSRLRYEGCNRTYLEYRGLKHFNDLLGKTDQELGWYNNNSTQTLEEINIIAKNEGIANRMENDGKNWLLANKRPFHASSSEERGIIGVYIDMTQQYNRILDLERHEKHYRELIENLPNVAVQGFDQDRRVTYWNHSSAKLFGYSKEEVMGKKIEELLYPSEIRDRFIALIDTWLTQNRPIKPMVDTLIHKDGSPVKVHSSLLLIDRNTPNPIFFSVTHSV
jgi:PAS domain S-box-containing protein